MQFLVGYFVERFIFLIVGVLFLNCVVCQVDFRFEVADIELVRCRPHVPFFVPPPPHHSEHVSYQHVVSDIELSAIVEQRTIDIHLHNVRTLCFLLIEVRVLCGPPISPLSLLDYTIKFVNFVDDSNASSLIAVLPRLDNPNVSFFILIDNSFLFLNLALALNLFCSFFVVVDKLVILWVFDSLADMEGQGQVVVHILLEQSVVLSQVIK